MPDSLLLDALALGPPTIQAMTRLPNTYDDALLLTTSQRWRDSSEALRELIAGIPAARDTLARWLEQNWDLGEPDIGLQFAATDKRAEHFVSLVQASAFVYQHPVLPSTLNAQCKVIGLPPAHALSRLAPQQLLERVKTQNLEQALQTAWNDYWNARAPGTPVSRRERASQLYCTHLEATAQLAFARRQLTVAQLKPLALLMDASTTMAQVTTEKVALVLSNGSKVKLPAAWVIRFENATPFTQWLYLPLRSEAFKGFAGRPELEAWMIAQDLVPQGLSSADLKFEYTERNLPLSTGMTDLLEHLRLAQLNALRNGRLTSPDLAEHAGKALDQVDLADRQRSTTAVFASPPRTMPVVADNEEPALFGSLHAHTPWELRQAALNRERTALESLCGTANNSGALATLKAANEALENAEQAADTAATALLGRARPFDLETFNREFTALHKAHKEGLQAETGLQHLLGHLTDNDRDQLNLLLETPASPDVEYLAASLTVTLSEQTGDKHTLTLQELNGPFVIAHPDALFNQAAPYSVLLYWPGTGGGLQRFADRQSLENQVFKIAGQDKSRALQLKKITGDPLQYSLNALIGEFEEHAAVIRTRLGATSQAAEQAEQLTRLRDRFNVALQVPVNAARNLALAHIQEQGHTATLVANLPDWLGNLSAPDRVALNTEIRAFIKAMQMSHALMTKALEPRDDFTRKHLHTRLRTDFKLEGDFSIRLDLPDRVTWETRYSAGPTGPQRISVMVASAKRSSMSLEELAQLNIDKEQSVKNDPLAQRLTFMQLNVVADNRQDRLRLLNGLNLTYLRKTLPELDLPKAYERLIIEAFKGVPGAAPFALAHHRECLLEPWRQTLNLQGRFARLQNQINDDELQTLQIAATADTAQAWQLNNKHVVILPATLTVGGKDTPLEGPATLSGVTFIKEQLGGATLLYLPDSPDGRFLRSYANLQAARLGLYNLCQQDAMINYLAGRALHGNVRAHRNRISQAVSKRFDAIIGVGTRWPVTTSLAAHLLDTHMGRLILAHRDTSRSNDQLYLERYALRGPRAFNYMKMALGMLPFIGTALALYDAWSAANEATAAFLRGEIGDGLEELKNMLLCLLDAVVDLLPGEALAGALASAARAVTRTRQMHRVLRNVTALHGITRRHARHLIARFDKYVYEQPISLAGLQAGTHGIYRGIYRHADGDFIVRQGRIFAVQLDNDSRFWRLRGTRQATYKQPIALDETGQWDTWFGVHGTSHEGGGLGGGNVYGHLADAIDPFWPQGIRDRLPRWWADRTFRRSHDLKAQDEVLRLQLGRQRDASEILMNRVVAAKTPEERLSLIPAAEAAVVSEIEMGLKRYQGLAELASLARGNKRTLILEIQGGTATLLTDRYLRRAIHNSHSTVANTGEIRALTTQLNALPADALVERLKVLEKIRLQRLEYLKKVDLMIEFRNEANHWNGRIRIAEERGKLAKLLNDVNTKHSDLKLNFQKAFHRLEVVQRYGAVGDVSWYYLLGQTRDLRRRVARALDTHHGLPDAQVTRAQREEILQHCIGVYTQFRREMNIWTSSYPQHFHLEMVEPFLSGMDFLTTHARKQLGTPLSAPRRREAGEIAPRAFPTEDQFWLIGVEQWDTRTQRTQYRMDNGEVWEQLDNGRYRPIAATPVIPEQQPPNLRALVSEARTRLNAQSAYLSRVESYAGRDMLPVDLEHMMVSESSELTSRADRIQMLAAQDPIIAQLRSKATELIATGRTLRTRQTLASQKPTDGMLLDLIEQNAVEIRKVAPLKNLSKPKARKDFMQEYEIWNRTCVPPELHWYAHFHYSSATPLMRMFEKAHLKLPEHRFLTHADDADLPYADIGKQSAVLVHFEAL